MSEQALGVGRHTLSHKPWSGQALAKLSSTLTADHGWLSDRTVSSQQGFYCSRSPLSHILRLDLCGTSRAPGHTIFPNTVSAPSPTSAIHLISAGSAVYVHSIKWPLFARFDMPEKYGFARTSPQFRLTWSVLNGRRTASKTLNLQLTTSDNVTLGAWFILSDAFYHSQPVQPTAETLPVLVPKALSAHPTVLFLHGNAGTRAVRFRAQLCATLSARLGANVLALDYRGFGDSEGSPSEAGVARDTWAAWDWLAAQGARAGDVVVMGHSLGTGIGAQFVHELEETGVHPRGLVLLAPFSNIRTLLDTYYILGMFPLMKPLELIPGAKREFPRCYFSSSF